MNAHEWPSIARKQAVSSATIVLSLLLGRAFPIGIASAADPQLTPANAMVMREVQAGGAQVYIFR